MIVVADRPQLEVVIGQRRAGSAFVGGMIVFPGGGVDPEDRSPAARLAVPAAVVPDMDAGAGAAFLHAGIRETDEEVGLDLLAGGVAVPEDFPHVGHWITPENSVRRYDTHFFLARHRGGEVVADRIELVDAWWESPGIILDRIEKGALDAIAPTLAFLEALARHTTVAEVYAAAGAGERSGHDHGWTRL